MLMILLAALPAIFFRYAILRRPIHVGLALVISFALLVLYVAIVHGIDRQPTWVSAGPAISFFVLIIKSPKHGKPTSP